MRKISSELGSPACRRCSHARSQRCLKSGEPGWNKALDRPRKSLCGSSRFLCLRYSYFSSSYKCSGERGWDRARDRPRKVTPLKTSLYLILRLTHVLRLHRIPFPSLCAVRHPCDVVLRNSDLRSANRAAPVAILQGSFWLPKC